jgi:hypothetical protein
MFKVNQGMLFSQANQIFGNNVMNPQQQQRWMVKPPSDSSGLAYLKPLDSFLINQVVSITECIYSIEFSVKKLSFSGGWNCISSKIWNI